MKSHLVVALALACLLPMSSGTAWSASSQKNSRSETSVNATTQRVFTDRARDVTKARDVRVRRTLRRAVDIRRVRVWQVADAGYVSIRLARKMPLRASQARHLSVFLERARPRDPHVWVDMVNPPKRRAKILALWSDGSRWNCRAKVHQSHRGRTFTVKLPNRCEWWKAKAVTVDASLSKKNYFHSTVWDTKRVRARLAWDDHLD